MAENGLILEIFGQKVAHEVIDDSVIVISVENGNGTMKGNPLNEVALWRFGDRENLR